MTDVITAYIHGLPEGRITDNSVIVIEGRTYPIPASVSSGGHAAPPRISQAIRDAGYRAATDYYSDLGTLHPDGIREIRLVKA